MSTQFTPVVVGSGRLLLSGTLCTGGHRVAEVLSETSSDFVRLQDAQLTSGYAGRATRVVPEALIPKAGIAVILLPSEKHEAAGRRRYAVVKKAQRAVYLVAGDFEVSGHIHIKGSADAILLLNQALGAYFAVTDATVYCAERSIDVPVVLINKAQVSVFCMGGSQILEQQDEMDAAEVM